MLSVGGRMLVVFLPQVVLYGVGIVLAGVLQAHRRFLGPALAPLLSSLVVITAYLLYAAQGRGSLADLTTAQELTLSVGTTLGVAVLSLGLLVPLRRCNLPLRPTLSFPTGVAPRVRVLAAAGVVGLAAQPVALVVALRLAANGAEGSVVVFQVATALFLLPWAVLAVPIATSAFPGLAASADSGDEPAYTDTAGRALAAVLVATFGGAVVLAAVAAPAARVLVAGAPGLESVQPLTHATVAFAPGLIGYGILALVGRALYARGDGRTPATATVAGWAAVAVTDVAVVAARPELDRVVALGIGNTVGMTLAAGLLVLGLRRAAPAAVDGSARSLGAGVAGCVVAGAVAIALPSFGESLLASALACVLVAAVTGGIYLGVVRLLDPAGLRALVRA
jgi:putative peptidoglycan lipid II flippase